MSDIEKDIQESVARLQKRLEDELEEIKRADNERVPDESKNSDETKG